jgi:hypothetical protein
MYSSDSMSIDLRRFLSGPGPILGYLLVLLWCTWWAANLLLGRMVLVDYSWIRLPAFGVDFEFHIDKPIRIWLAGGDPYADKERMFSYPPIVLRLYTWIALTTPQLSVRIWMVTAAVFAAVGAIAAVGWRNRLGLEQLPPGIAVALILFSTPVLFAIERANYDLLIVPCIVGAAMLMQRKSETADVVAALLLAIAIWAKLYPGLLLVAVVALGRWRVFAWLTAWCILIGLSDLPELRRFFANNDIAVNTAYWLARQFPEILPWNHPLSSIWVGLSDGTWLARIPGSVAASVVVLPLLGWVSWSMVRSARSDDLALPFMFWTVAAGTYAVPVSNDYNLTPLPLAILATWSARDGWPIGLVLAALALWWQPFSLPFPGWIILLVKIAGLAAAAAILVRRAQEPAGTRPNQPKRYFASSSSSIQTGT